ncbi:MAG TPA: hypothetical protein VL199_10940 [Burkholderiales bacterium]|jgi:hypothetical protein|nr:hypothetical protein [Burkholderiales bacterium]
MAEFKEWESFYVIVGGAAGALIGLQFVVMTLLADRPQLATPEGGAAFATPTVVHFGTVLLLAAGLRVPWHGIGSAAAFWGSVGIAGFIYMLLVIRRMRRQSSYRPDWEDWLSHGVLPLAAYLVLLASGLSTHAHEGVALLAVGAATLLLLFTGIHNSWDMIAYQVFVRLRDKGD